LTSSLKAEKEAKPLASIFIVKKIGMGAHAKVPHAAIPVIAKFGQSSGMQPKSKQSQAVIVN
jgi:hypothetical protein